MFKIYECYPKYCRVTDALIGETRTLVATLPTRADARTFVDERTQDEDVRYALMDVATGHETTFCDPPQPSPVSVDTDEIPF